MSVARRPPPVPRTGDPLDPVRGALLARAQRDAARTLSDAEAEAGTIRDRARRRAEAIRDEARAQGEADGRTAVAAERIRARRRARAVVLRAQHDAYARLCHQARAAVAVLAREPDYPGLRDRLAATARTLVGQRATVTVSPDGGVVAEARGRRAVLTLSSLADRALDRIAADIDGLWAP